MTSTPQLGWRGPVLVLTAASLVCIAADWGSPVRSVVVLAFVLAAPGLALTELLGVSDLVLRWSIAPSASLAITTLVSVTLLYAGAFSMGLAIGLVAAITILLLAATAVVVPPTAVREVPDDGAPA